MPHICTSNRGELCKGLNVDSAWPFAFYGPIKTTIYTPTNFETHHKLILLIDENN